MSWYNQPVALKGLKQGSAKHVPNNYQPVNMKSNLNAIQIGQYARVAQGLQPFHSSPRQLQLNFVAIFNIKHEDWNFLSSPLKQSSQV